MLFRNSLRLLMENFKGVYKILFYKLVVGLIAIALFAVILVPQLLSLYQSDAVQTLVAEFSQMFTALFSADALTLANTKEAIFGGNGALYAVAKLLASETLSLVLAALGCIVVYLLKRYVETLCYFSVGSTLNDKMTTYAETPFFSSFVENLGKASVYALVYVPVSFVFDIFIVGVAVALLSFIDLLPALFFAVTFTVLLQSLKLTLAGYWMPAVTADGKRMREAIKRTEDAEKKIFRKIFATYVAVIYTVIIVNVVATFATFGSALILTVPASYAFLICQQYVNYYTVRGKKYFITYEKIASNPDKGDREHFFDYIEESETETVGNEKKEKEEEKEV